MEKKRILFLLHLPPPIHGSSMVGQSIANSKVVNERYECQYINLLASQNVAETGKIRVGKVWGFVKIWFKLLKALIFSKPALCYFAVTSTGAAFYRDLLLVVLLKVFRVKRLYHLHNKGVKNASNNGVKGLLYKYAFSGADVILLSQLLYDDVKRFVPIERVLICPNGISDTIEVDLLNASEVVRSSDIKILFLSNLIESKGVYVLLDACKELKDQGVFFSCRFVGGEGDISIDQLLSRIAILGLEQQVRYLGRLYGNEKIQVFRASDIFVFPTFYRNETFGLVNLEAMQNSLPIISTNEGGIPDVIEDGITGFLIPKQDSVELAAKLKLLIEDPALRRRMGSAGRLRYEQNFTLEHFEHRLLSILKKVMN